MQRLSELGSNISEIYFLSLVPAFKFNISKNVNNFSFLFPISGLKKFLAQYPSIFLIDGDYVNVNSFQSTASDENAVYGSGKRDYIEESKDYFKNKLLQYGLGTEVPIKSLLGHRSQASPQVRHISGKDFLFD